MPFLRHDIQPTPPTTTLLWSETPEDVLDADLSGVLEFEEMILSVMKVGVTCGSVGPNVVLPFPGVFFFLGEKQSKFGILYLVCLKSCIQVVLFLCETPLTL